MEDFLKKLFETDNKLSLLLLEAKDLSDEYEEKELSSYIDKEINGYKVEDGLPDYRKIAGQIVGDIQDVYGNLTHKESPIDFSVLSEKVRFNLDILHIPDGISFIEASLDGITGKTALKPIPNQVVKMLNETFHLNNPQLHLVGAYHKVPVPTLKYILVKVRQDLIQSFQKLNKKLQKSESQNTVEKPIESSKMQLQQRKIFVSYAWEDEEHNSKVISFVDFLRNEGFDASMDRKKSQEETSVNFNQMMIDGIQNSDKVIVVLSRKFKEKAEKFEGGVWQEFSIAIEEMKQKKNKYIYVFFGKEKREEVTPTAILGVDILDLKNDQDENNFNTLFAKIKEENTISFSEVSQQVKEVQKIIIKPFKL
ncbi:hypothetical protein GCM10011506_03280 [Marivirga lumbricoides]|uniref:SEFIR domain-containing protein n=1 Tax=Marivirga lumbricoides TaxID=1046115 RepID=A0ABQ1LCP9_9BACT|nr:hypothetical protein GCM10011506_03280 [Marivirga lumbricoides]